MILRRSLRKTDFELIREKHKGDALGDQLMKRCWVYRKNGSVVSKKFS